MSRTARGIGIETRCSTVNENADTSCFIGLETTHTPGFPSFSDGAGNTHSPRDGLLRKPSYGQRDPVSGELIVSRGDERRRQAPRERGGAERSSPRRYCHLQIVHGKHESGLLVLRNQKHTARRKVSKMKNDKKVADRGGGQGRR